MSDGLTPLDEARRALQDSEGRLQQVLDNTSALVFAKDRAGRYLFVNREFECITGRPSVEVIGRTDEMVFPADIATRFRHNDLRVLRDGHAIEFEEVADFGAGARTFLSSKFPLLDAEGQAYAVCGIATDITERKQAVEALRDSEAQYRAIFNASEDALVLFDSTLRRVDVNPAFERMYGWTRDEVLGKGYEEAAPQDRDLPTRQDNLRRALAGETTRSELDAVRKDGERIRIEMIAVPFRLRGEQHVLAIGRDITERKRLEDALSSAALAVSQSEGEALFRELARYLAAILRVDAVFIATVDPPDSGQMQVRAMQLDGRTVENFSYDLPGTPCETVVGQQFRFYPSRLQELFPLDSDFRGLGFNGYAGHPLSDAAGRPLGLLAVVSREPLENPALVESVLRIFAVRVQAELERVAAQDALRASEASYREIFEASDDAIFVHDWDTAAIVDANPQACRAYGYTREELLRIRLGDMSSGLPPFTGEEGLRLFERAKQDGGARFEWHRRSKDGSLHWDEVRLKAATIGGTPRLLAFTREITERKEAEQALRASEEQYRTVFNASADALVLCSQSERVDVNPAYERIYGYTRAEVLAGERTRELTDEIHQLQIDIIERTLKGEPYCGEIETVRRGGERFPIEVRTVPIQHRGEPHVLVMIRDLTERRKVEEERAALEAQLRQAQRMEAIGQLTGGIAHDFNNLLTSIMGYVTLAGEREAALADPRLGNYLAQAQRSCERARDLIQQMLMFSRGQRGEPRTVALAPLVEDALATVRPALPPSIDLRTDFAAAAPTVRLDPLQLEQVLLNLCINARDACAESAAAAIEVETRPVRVQGSTCAGCRGRVDGEYVELVVADNGHGMAPGVLERVFEPFFSTKSDGKGTGMGLAMVHGIVHEHGGHVLVESTPGAGSRFRVLWPVVPAEPGVPSVPPTPASQRTRPPRPTLRGAVLIVDDEVAVGEFMRELLETWGIDATFVPAPKAALELVAEAPARFDVVITDQTMPRMTGLQLAQALQRVRPDLPVVLYSGYGDGLARPELAAAGIRTVLRKPIEPAALDAALRGLLPAEPERH